VEGQKPGDPWIFGILDPEPQGIACPINKIINDF